ncbi:MAG: aminoacyl-tRNA hydrolase [Candidatus Shapirobacteria bacterium]
MKYFFGLGNPGKQYEKTRHNIGHQIISILKEKNPPNCKLETNTGFMNEAGLSAQKFVHFYKVNLDNFYLVHDDLDLPVGEYRIQFDRGPAGHHGVESVIGHIGSQAFNRIRVGIGKPINQVPVEDFVLLPFTKEEKVIINETIDKIVEKLK